MSDSRPPKATVYPFPVANAGGSLAGGPGGPHDPTMETRLRRLEDMFARVEALMTSVDERLRKVEIEVAEVRGRLTHLPSTWAMITTMLGGQVALAAAILAILRLVSAH